MIFVEKGLGPTAEDILSQTSSDIRKRQRKLEKERRDFQISQQNLRGKDEEIQNLTERLNKEQAKTDQLKETPGLENEAELKSKEQLVKNLKKDLEIKQKGREGLEKKFKDQKKAQEKIDQLQTSISEEEKNAMEEKLNSTKTFDALKEQESHLQRLNEENQAIIQDEMASSLDKEAAEERVPARNEELTRL